jgi:hypothetical protein
MPVILNSRKGFGSSLRTSRSCFAKVMVNLVASFRPIRRPADRHESDIERPKSQG